MNTATSLPGNHRAQLNAILASLVCAHCARAPLDDPPAVDDDWYIYLCPCGAEYDYSFDRVSRRWSWLMTHDFDLKDERWASQYDSYADQTRFWRWRHTKSGGVPEDIVLPGYVPETRFAKLIAFA